VAAFDVLGAGRDVDAPLRSGRCAYPGLPQGYQLLLHSKCYDAVVNLREWAVANGVHPVTAYRWFREGKLLVPATRVGGLILIDQPANTVPAGVSVVYARVSSGDQRQDLERQVARVATWATGRNLSVDRIVTEVGSALDGRRRKLLTLLGDPDVTTVVVEHRDRFARFGAEYVEAVLSARAVGCWSWTLLKSTMTLCVTRRRS
jgi:predicted site-specific integrase-resolvase